LSLNTSADAKELDNLSFNEFIMSPIVVKRF